MTEDYINFLPPEEEWPEIDSVKIHISKSETNRDSLCFYLSFPESFTEKQQKDFIENTVGIFDALYKDIGGDALVIGKISKVNSETIKINPN